MLHSTNQCFPEESRSRKNTRIRIVVEIIWVSETNDLVATHQYSHWQTVYAYRVTVQTEPYQSICLNLVRPTFVRWNGTILTRECFICGLLNIYFILVSIWKFWFWMVHIHIYDGFRIVQKTTACNIIKAFLSKYSWKIEIVYKLQRTWICERMLKGSICVWNVFK